MCARRLLLIDADNDFHRILHEQVSPYGFEIYPVAENTDALSHIDSIAPELAFIAVEEPDKLGYSLCSRAKKGAHKELPIILTTASVPPSGFNSHRRLSVHADEYIDKRTMSGQELLDKIDVLIGLGASSVEMVDMDQVESISMVDELFGEEEEKTRIAPPDILMAVDMAGVPEEPSDGPYTSAQAPSAQSAAWGRDDGGQGGFVDEENLRTTAFPDAVIPTQHGVAPLADGPPPRAGDRSVPDLGLDRVAESVSQERSGRHQSPTQSRLHELERDNERLRAELEKIRSSSDPGGASAFSREREFLNLREVINRKEKELNELRDEVDAKDRQILDGKSQSRQLQREKTDLESRILEHEQQILAQSEESSGLEAEKHAGLERIRSLEHEIAERDQVLADTRAQNAQQVVELEANHAAALQQQKEEDEATRQTELNQQRDDYEGQLARLREQGELALQQAEAEHQAAQQAAVAETLANAEREAQAAQEAALAEAATQHQGQVAELESNHAAEVAQLRQEHADATAEAESRAQDRLASTEAEHARIKTGLEGEKAALESELATTRGQLAEMEARFSEATDTIGERDAAIAENLAAIEARDQRIGALEQDVAELEEQNTGYQDQILQAYKKIKSDEATVDKAKRAIAVALTLLDENIVDLGAGAGRASAARDDPQ